MLKSLLFWFISFIMMVAVAYYQKATGPTYPIKGEITVHEETIQYNLPRSSTVGDDHLIKLIVSQREIKGEMKYKRFPSYDDWSVQTLERKDDTLIARIPEQPPAGKIKYDIYLYDADGKEFQLSERTPIIRYKGYVPAGFLIPHIIFIFAAMWLSTRTGFEALSKGKNVWKFALWTTILLLIGGLIMGPIIQKYAFGAYWTGWPFGNDLTDNKTIVAFIFWVIALWRLKVNPHKTTWALIASIVLIAVFLIPHSVLGSEIDYTKMAE